MIKRVFFNLMLFALFAVTQTGIGMHEITHIDPDILYTESDQQDKNTAQEHCDHCLAQADADTADIPVNFHVPLATHQHQLATIPVATLVSRLPRLYSPRAPPTV